MPAGSYLLYLLQADRLVRSERPLVARLQPRKLVGCVAAPFGLFKRDERFVQSPLSQSYSCSLQLVTLDRLLQHALSGYIELRMLCRIVVATCW